MLLKNANQINEEGLTNEHELYLNQLCTFLADPDDAQTERNEIKIVRQYLWLVSRVVGWSYVLLILCTLGKHKLQKLDEDRRIKLVKHIVQNRGSLSCPRLEQKATHYNLCQIRMTLPPLHCFVSKDLSQMSKPIFHLREAPESAREKWSLKPKINKARLWLVSYRMSAPFPRIFHHPLRNTPSVFQQPFQYPQSDTRPVQSTPTWSAQMFKLRQLPFSRSQVSPAFTSRL